MLGLLNPTQVLPPPENPLRFKKNCEVKAFRNPCLSVVLVYRYSKAWKTLLVLPASTGIVLRFTLPGLTYVGS